MQSPDIGYCAAKKTRFHGVRLHCLAQRRARRLPLPNQVWLCAASHHDSKAFIEQQPEIATTELFGDLAYPTPEIINHLKEEQARLMAPQKKPKGKELSDVETYYNRLVRRIRQPIESLFHWRQEKTGIQRASKVRSTDALMVHGWESWQSLSFSSFSTTDSHTSLMKLQCYEHDLIKDALVRANGSVTQAASLPGASHQRIAQALEKKHRDLLPLRAPVIRRPTSWKIILPKRKAAKLLETPPLILSPSRESRVKRPHAV